MSRQGFALPKLVVKLQVAGVFILFLFSINASAIDTSSVKNIFSQSGNQLASLNPQALQEKTTICLDSYHDLDESCPAGLSADLCEMFKIANTESNDSVRKISQNCIEISEEIDVTSLVDQASDDESLEGEDNQHEINTEELDVIVDQLIKQALEESDLAGILGQFTDSKSTFSNLTSPQQGYVDRNAAQGNAQSSQDNSGASGPVGNELLPMLMQLLNPLSQNGAISSQMFPGLSPQSQNSSYGSSPMNQSQAYGYLDENSMGQSVMSNIVSDLALCGDGVGGAGFIDGTNQARTAHMNGKLSASKHNYVVIPVEMLNKGPQYRKGAKVRLTNQETGKQIYAIIGDLGPKKNDPWRRNSPKLEMSYHAAVELGLKSNSDKKDSMPSPRDALHSPIKIELMDSAPTSSLAEVETMSNGVAPSSGVNASNIA